MSPEQQEWFEQLVACQILSYVEEDNREIYLPELYIWRPADLHSGMIEKVLR